MFLRLKSLGRRNWEVSWEGEGYNYEYRNKTENNPQSGNKANAAGKHNYPNERKSR